MKKASGACSCGFKHMQRLLILWCSLGEDKIQVRSCCPSSHTPLPFCGWAQLCRVTGSDVQMALEIQLLLCCALQGDKSTLCRFHMVASWDFGIGFPPPPSIKWIKWDKMKFTRKKNKTKQQKYSMKTLNFNQLHLCRLNTGSSRGLSRLLRALSAVCKLTFTREDSLGIVHTNHSTEGCAAVKGTGAYNHILWKIPSWASNIGEILQAIGWKVWDDQLCWQHPVKMHEEQNDSFLLNVSATV